MGKSAIRGDWKKKQKTRARVKLTIEKTLDLLPEVYTTEIFNQKCDLVSLASTNKTLEVLYLINTDPTSF